MASSHLDLVGDQIAEDVAHIDAALHRVLTKIRVFDSGAGWADQGFRSCAGWLSWRVGWSTTTAREHVRVANALAGLPRIDRALERGELSYCKARAITRVATADNEHVLLEQAQLLTGAQLDALCRKYASVRDHDDPANSNPRDDLERRYITRRDRDDGMVVIEAVLHPDEAARVWIALERVAADRCRARTAPTSSTSKCASAEAEVTAGGSDNDGANASAEAGVTAGGSKHGANAFAEAGVTAGGSKNDGDAFPEAEGFLARGSERRVANASAEAPGTLCASRYGASNGCAKNETSHARRPAFDRADALVQIAEEILRGDSPSRSPTEIVISVPLETLQNPDVALGDPSRIAASADGTGLSTQAIRRLACDCGVVPLVEDAHGNPLHAGRKHRVIAGALKRALLHRDNTCRFPGFM